MPGRAGTAASSGCHGVSVPAGSEPSSVSGGSSTPRLGSRACAAGASDPSYIRPPAAAREARRCREVIKNPPLFSGRRDLPTASALSPRLRFGPMAQPVGATLALNPPLRVSNTSGCSLIQTRSSIARSDAHHHVAGARQPWTTHVCSIRRSAQGVALANTMRQA